VNIGRNVFIGLRCTLDHAYPEQIYIDDDVSLAGDVYIVAHSNPYPHFRRILLSYVAAVRIKQGCWIGARATILPGVQIGEYSVVSAGSVVQYNISPLSIVRGNPAQIIKRIKHIDK
jgi:acetyltransferase-like isoleucine patch superfamily enzyme